MHRNHTGLHAWLLSLMLSLIATVAMAKDEPASETNIASSAFGALALACSPGDDPAAIALDSWSPQPEAGVALPKTMPCWVIVDLVHSRLIHKITVDHGGVLECGKRVATNFQLQCADTAQGPWTPLFPTIVSNTRQVTTHQFAPVQARYLRLEVTKLEPMPAAMPSIRIDAFTEAKLVPPPLKARIPYPPVYRNGKSGLEQLVRLPGMSELTQETSGLQLALGLLGTVPVYRDLNTTIGYCWIPAVKEATAVPAVLRTRADSKNAIVAETVLNLAPASYFAGGTIEAIPTSHNDLAWIDTHEKTFALRDREIITPGLDLLAKHPSYCFNMECVYYLMEYLERHPERKEQIQQFAKEGRFEWGATFNEPFETLFPNESLVRQLYYGRRWFRKTFPDCDVRAAWSPDVPARAFQMPQILSKAGVPYLIFGRYREGIYRWLSPDGSSVVAYSPHQYWTAGEKIAGTLDEVEKKLPTALKPWEVYYQKHSIQPHFPVMMSFDFLSPTHIFPLIDEVNKATRVTQEEAQGVPVEALQIRHSTATRFLDEVTQGSPDFETLRGERPDVWFHEHALGHYEAVEAGRQAARLIASA